MKARVKYYNGLYYPQIKGFIFWNYLSWHDNYAYFDSEEKAKEFIASGKWKYQNQVVWKGEV